jgi:hypothetical protein
LPENPGTQGSPSQQYSGPVAPAFQPVAAPGAAPFQPVGAQSQPVAAPVKSGGGSALKIVLIVLAIFVGLGILGAGVVGYGIWRVSRAIHMSGSNGQVSINTPNGTISAKSAETFTADDLGTDIYPGAQPVKGGMRMNMPNGSMLAANFVTSDSKEQVIAFYKERSGSQGSVMEAGDAAILTLSKGKQDSVMLTITQKANQFDGKTQIHILHTVDKKAP